MVFFLFNFLKFSVFPNALLQKKSEKKLKKGLKIICVIAFMCYIRGSTPILFSKLTIFSGDYPWQI